MMCLVIRMLMRRLVLYLCSILFRFRDLAALCASAIPQGDVVFSVTPKNKKETTIFKTFFSPLQFTTLQNSISRNAMQQ